MNIMALGGRFEEPPWDEELHDSDPFYHGTVVVEFGGHEVCRLPASWADSKDESVALTISEWLSSINDHLNDSKAAENAS